MKKRFFGKMLATLMAASLVVIPQSFTVNADTATGTDAIAAVMSDVKMRDNITIKGKDVSGLTYHEALEALGGDEYIGQANVEFSSEYGNFKATLSELGLTDNTEEIVKEALQYGNSGNVLKRYKDIKQLDSEPLSFDIERGVDEDLVDDVIFSNIGSVLDGLNEYSLEKHEDGSVNVKVEGQTVGVDVAATKALIEDYISSPDYIGGTVPIDVVMTDSSDNQTMQQVARVKDLLGTYTTNYGSSSASRKTNVQRAASLVNGHLLFPGEMISVYNTIAPIEVSNGYEMAHAYVGTEVVDSAGGGVCQVATTLYNAAIIAEIEIVQRDCHSLRVSYVPISADAAIAGGVLDLKLRNNLDAPIYIEALYDGANLSFNIYGEEYREPGRTIEFESVQTGVIEPSSDPIYTEDKSLPPGTEEVTAGAVTGYTGELWKHIYKDGVKVDSVLVNKSKYQASPAKISINSDPGGEETAGDEDDNTDPNANPEGTDPNQQQGQDPNQQQGQDPNQQQGQDPNQQQGGQDPNQQQGQDPNQQQTPPEQQQTPEQQTTPEGQGE